MRSDGIELKIIVPVDQLPTSPPAEYFSQENCEQLLGLKRRTFLELLRRVDAPPVTKLGKTRTVERHAMLEFLRRIRERETEARRAGALDEADEILLAEGCLPSSKRKTG